MSPLLKKLRIKFVLATSGIVALLIVVVAAAYCLSIYTSAKGEIDVALDRAINNSIEQPQEQERGAKPNAQTPQDIPVDSEKQTQAETQPQTEAISGETASFSANQRIDLFRGTSALVYSAVLDESGVIVRYDSPVITLDDSVLASAFESIKTTPGFDMTSSLTLSGRLSSENLFYKIRVDNGYAYLALADAGLVDSRLQAAIFGLLSVAGIALLLTVIGSFFLTRLFIRPVEEAWDKQRRFVADASHELKTPLTVIMANTDIVRLDPQSSIGSHMKWLDGIVYESERMNGLIADLLLLARLDDEAAPKDYLKFEDVDFSEIVEKSLMSFEAIAFERHLSLQGKITPHITVSGIPSRLLRLPDILIDNACKYAPQESTVTIELEKQGSNAILRVLNASEVLEETDLERLFDRFYRADVSRSSETLGYGLGLSIAQSIVEEAKGRITAERVLEEGIAFTVSLPLLKR